MNLPVISQRKGSLTFIAIIFLFLVAIVITYQLKTVDTQVHSNNLRIAHMLRTIEQWILKNDNNFVNINLDTS